MRRLNRTLTTGELAEALELPPELVDALLESGRILCELKGGEPRVPLDQLELFFRDALLRIYRAEAQLRADPAPAVAHSEAVAEQVTAEQPEPLAETEPEPDAMPDRPTLVAEPLPIPPREEPEDFRGATRYVPLRQINGLFADVKFNIIQISATGLRIRHKEELLPGAEAKLTFALIKPARSVVVRARVVWTSLARAGDEEISISGLKVIQHAERLERAIATLNEVHELQPERRVQVRRASDAGTVLREVSDEEMALVTAAVQKFSSDPIEATRWYARGRFANSDEAVRRIAPQHPREREEVLGIWEYLDRQVDIAKIQGVLTWMRAG